MNNFLAIENPELYWTNQFKKLPVDIQKHIRALGRNNGGKMIELTKKLYKQISRDTHHTEEFKPYYAFAKMARAYTIDVNRRKKK